MDWQMVGALAEVLGAIGVILTLIFLTLQIRQNTKALRGASYQAAIASVSEVSREIGLNQDAADIVLRGNRSPDQLSEIEWVRYSALNVALMRNFENTFYQYRSGMIEADAWQGWRQAILAQFFAPGTQKWYTENRSRYHPAFQKFLADARKTDLEAALALGERARATE
jgi:hypothetical protein